MKQPRLVFALVLLALLSSCGLKRNLTLPKDQPSADAQSQSPTPSPSPSPTPTPSPAPVPLTPDPNDPSMR